MELPKIRRLGSYTYCRLGEEILTSTELAHSEIMLLSDCKLMAATLKKHSQRFNAIQVGKQTLSGNDLDIIQRTLKKKVVDELEWFENINYPKAPHVSDIPRNKLTAFKTILMNGIDNKCFDKQNSTLLVSDLSLLTSKNWLNLEIINVFIQLINNSRTTGQVISLSDIQHSTREMLKQKPKEWKSNGIECCVIILNVMQLKNGTTQVATVGNQGNHWSCLKVDFANKT